MYVRTLNTTNEQHNNSVVRTLMPSKNAPYSPYRFYQVLPTLLTFKESTAFFIREYCIAVWMNETWYIPYRMHVIIMQNFLCFYMLKNFKSSLKACTTHAPFNHHLKRIYKQVERERLVYKVVMIIIIKTIWKIHGTRNEGKMVIVVFYWVKWCVWMKIVLRKKDNF